MCIELFLFELNITHLKYIFCTTWFFLYIYHILRGPIVYLLYHYDVDMILFTTSVFVSVPTLDVHLIPLHFFCIVSYYDALVLKKNLLRRIWSKRIEITLIFSLTFVSLNICLHIVFIDLPFLQEPDSNSHPDACTKAPGNQENGHSDFDSSALL